MRTHVVVKVHEREQFAVSVHSGSLSECKQDAAKANGLYHDVEYINFFVYPSATYDNCVDAERRGGESVYNSLPISERIIA